MKAMHRLPTMVGILLTVLCCALAVSWAQLQPSSTTSAATAEQEVRAAEAQRLKAFLDHDVKAMSTLMGDDLIHTTTTGKTRNKTQFMDDFTNRPTAFSQFVTDEMEVIVIGEAAITRGKYHNLVAHRSYGTPLKYARFLRVWAKRNGSWRLVSHQATEIQQPSH